MALSLSFTSSALYPKFIHHHISPSSTSSSVISFVHSFRAYFPRRTKTSLHQRRNQGLEIKALTLDFSGSFFEGGFGGEEDSSTPVEPGITAVEEKEEPQCPPGLRQYETMAVLRPDMSEDERLALTQKYEECFLLAILLSGRLNLLWKSDYSSGL